jgi:hypothetical protein
VPRVILFVLVLSIAACSRSGSSEAPPSQSSPATPALRASTQHLRIQGTTFVRADGSPFEWRGISAFALIEQIATGRSAAAETYLAWAASQKITVVRVLVMAQHLFKLSPEQGRASLPRLLEMADTFGLHVEIVALADTAGTSMEFEQHVKDVGAIAARHGNALVEIANEPGHPTQDARLHQAATLKSLAALVPEQVPVALGSAEYGDEFAGGDYATFHFPRDTSDDGWGHVRKLADGAAFVERWAKPVVSDEPIGAGERFVAGRRDDDSRRFGAAALLTRFAGMYPTFHYENGLLAKQPMGRELDAFNAWRLALDVFTDKGVPTSGRFLRDDEIKAIADVRGARGAFGRSGEREAWLYILDPLDRQDLDSLSVTWAEPWHPKGELPMPDAGVRLANAVRKQ